MARYFFVLVVLLGLTAASFFLSSFLPQAVGLPIALGIAAVKAVLVGAVFMHLADAGLATRLVGIVTILFVAILCLGIAADVGLRY